MEHYGPTCATTGLLRGQIAEGGILLFPRSGVENVGRPRPPAPLATRRQRRQFAASTRSASLRATASSSACRARPTAGPAAPSHWSGANQERSSQGQENHITMTVSLH